LLAQRCAFMVTTLKKPIKLQLISNGKTLGSVDLQPITQLRLQTYAKINKISLMNMIDLAVRFSIAPEESDIYLKCPDEADFLATAAKMLRKVANVI
jgi:hypothetical protein